MENKLDILLAAGPRHLGVPARPLLEDATGAGNAMRPTVNPLRRLRGRMGARLGDKLIARDIRQLEPPLRDAIFRHELRVHFQAQFEVESGEGCGVEALARWTGPLGQEVPPTVFIPIAERLGLIVGFGTWMLRRACEEVSTWFLPGQAQPSLSVNVSSHQIDVSFCEAVAQILKDTGFPGNRLELEITESAMITDTERVIDCLWLWKALGVRIAVDDFGTGYSSLNYLSRLPIDRLKLDKSFVHRMLDDRKTRAIVRSIFSLAEDIGISVLAEGIESEGQMDALARLGCRQVQGYLLARPAPADEARAHLATSWGTRLRPTLFHPDMQEIHAS
jgi:diguanylate cyclase